MDLIEFNFWFRHRPTPLAFLRIELVVVVVVVVGRFLILLRGRMFLQSETAVPRNPKIAYRPGFSLICVFPRLCVMGGGVLCSVWRTRRSDSLGGVLDFDSR